MKNMKRAIRRHHYARLKNKYRKLNRRWVNPNDINCSYYNPKYVIDDSWVEKESAFMADTAARCSCAMCGNPRRTQMDGAGFYSLTRQEQKNLLDYKEQIGDMV